MGYRDTRRQARRRELLDAAFRVADAEGTDALTIARLAKEIGASVGGLYRYFPSKAAIIVAMQKDAIESYRGSLDAYLARAEARLGGVVEPRVAALCRVAAAFEAYLEDAVEHPLRHRLLDAFLSAPEPVLSEEEAREVDATLQPLLATCGELISRAAAAGALDAGDPEERTYLLWASLHGLDHFRKRDRIQPPRLRVKALTAGMLRSLLRGWGAAPDLVETALSLRTGA